MRGDTTGEGLVRIVLASISDTDGRMLRRGSRHESLTDENQDLAARPIRQPRGAVSVSTLRVFSEPISLPAALAGSGS